MCDLKNCVRVAILLIFQICTSRVGSNAGYGTESGLIYNDE